MATVITAGNATNGLSFTPDNTGSLEIKTGTGAGTTALTLTSSQTAMFAGTVQASGITTNLYPLVNATAVASTSGTSIDFTSIPSWVKRITVMFSGVSHNGSTAFNDQFLIQLGAGSITNSGYVSICVGTSATTGFLLTNSVAGAATFSGVWTIALIGSNTWSQSGNISGNGSCQYSAGTVTLGGVLDRVRVTTVGGTDTFDAGTINILYE